MVACGEGCLAEACDGEILFFGVCAERCALDGFIENCYGALDWFDRLAGDGSTGALTHDWCDG